MEFNIEGGLFQIIYQLGYIIKEIKGPFLFKCCLIERFYKK